MSYSRTAFTLFFVIFFSLILVSVCTGVGLFVDVFMVVLGTVQRVGTVVQNGSVDPSAVMQSIFNFSNPVLLIAPGIGLTLGLLLAILIASAMLKRTADVNWLEKHGERVMAEIKSISWHTGTRTNANGFRTSYPYCIIVAEWVDLRTRKIHTFGSGQLSSPGSYQVGHSVQVWIDPKDVSKYVMYVGR